MNGTDRGASMPPCLKSSGAIGAARRESEGDSRASSDARDDASRRVSFAPPPDEVRCRIRLAELRSKGFRPDYTLGDLCKRRQHMVVERTREDAFQSVTLMRLKDFAFTKNDDGTFTYSILALRSLEHPRVSDGRPGDRPDECLTFATSIAGDTRKLTKDQWVDSVRLVNVDDGLATGRDGRCKNGERHRRSNSDPGVTGWRSGRHRT